MLNQKNINLSFQTIKNKNWQGSNSIIFGQKLTFSYSFINFFLFYNYFSLFNYNTKYILKKYEIILNSSNKFFLHVINFIKYNKNTDVKFLADTCVYDKPGLADRFTLTYSLLSLVWNIRYQVSIKTNELTPVPTLANFFKTSVWIEREVWDMFGIIFSNHPDLRRILTDYHFNGHPLRKDFPLTGYVDLFYDEKEKKLAYVPVELAQEYRTFHFKNLWT